MVSFVLLLNYLSVEGLHVVDVFTGGILRTREDPQKPRVAGVPHATIKALGAVDNQTGPGLPERHAPGDPRPPNVLEPRVPTRVTVNISGSSTLVSEQLVAVLEGLYVAVL